MWVWVGVGVMVGSGFVVWFHNLEQVEEVTDAMKMQ